MTTRKPPNWMRGSHHDGLNKTSIRTIAVIGLILVPVWFVFDFFYEVWGALGYAALNARGNLRESYRYWRGNQKSTLPPEWGGP